MEPSQIGQPTESTQTPPEAASAPPSAPERSEGEPNLFERLFHFHGRERGETRDSSQDQPAAQEQPPAAASDEWKPPSSREEMQRWYQSQRDKERADEQRRQYQTDQQERTQRIQAIEQQKRELLQGHESWEVGEQVAELDRQILAEQDGTAAQDREGSLIGTVTEFYDHVWGNGFLEELPRAEQQRILAQTWQGPDGRVAMANEIRTALKKHLLAEGAKAERARLEKNQSYRKQLTHEFGIVREEPDHVPAGTGGNSHGPSMNEWLRSGFTR